MIPAGFIQDLLSRVDIVEVIGRHVELRRGGANWMGLCPFHAEKSPSFSVSPSKQFYYCFGCGASGDAIRFLTEHHGMSFFEAVEDLASRVGLQVPQEQVSAEERERRQKLSERRLSITEALQRAADHYRAQLRASPGAIDYLKRRGLSGEIAARFGLGWAPEGWRNLAGAFPRYDDPLLEECGLVRVSEDDAEGGERKRYDWFRGRVMFPIRAVSGEVIGFGGRVLDDSKPKYINSPETPVFAKGRELYGLFEARQSIRERGHVLVVEGYMDVVALAQSGFANAVATLGTACTADHVQKLFRFSDSIVFAFDGDAAGRRAAGRALEASLPYVSDMRNVRFLFLPPEHDPDSYVRELGQAAFEEQLATAVPLSRQFIEHASDHADLRTPEGRARLLAQARPLWQQLADSAFKRQLLSEIARVAELTGQELGQAWHIGEAPAPRRNAGPPPRMPIRLQVGRRAPAAPADLALRLLLRQSAWWDRLTAEDHELLHHLPGVHGEAVAWLERQITEHGPQTWAALAESATSHVFRAQLLGWANLGDTDEVLQFDALQRVLQQLWIERLGAQAHALASRAASSEELDELRQLRYRIDQLKRGLDAPS